MFRRRSSAAGTPAGLPRDEALAEVRVPRVDFLVVGAMKCGTTTVRRVLGRHGDVHMPDRELHFFGNHRRYLSVWRGGRVDPAAFEAAYGRHFRVERPVVGGKTPNYMVSSLTLERLQRFHPGARIVVMLREPVERARSHWDHLVRQRDEGRLPPHLVGSSFAEHLLRDERELACARHPDAEVTGTNVIYRGFYALQIRRIHRFFPADRVFVGVLDDLRDDRRDFFARLFAFLGLRADDAAIGTGEGERETPGGRRHELTTSERLYLHDCYEESVADLERLLGRELPSWRSAT